MKFKTGQAVTLVRDWPGFGFQSGSQWTVVDDSPLRVSIVDEIGVTVTVTPVSQDDFVGT